MNLRWIAVILVALVGLMFLVKGTSRRTKVLPGDIVFLGDSITAGYGLDPAQAYPALVHIPGMTTVNLGVSGSKSDDGLQRVKDYFDKGGKPSFVVIALGANDLLHGVSSSETETNLELAIQECQKRKIPVMLCGTRIPGKMGVDALYNKVSWKMDVPLLRDLLDGLQGQIQDDGHPTADGQKIIAGKMQEALLSRFSFSGHS